MTTQEQYRNLADELDRIEARIEKEGETEELAECRYFLELELAALLID